MQNIPLAERIRPKKLSEVIGQKHIIGKKGTLKNAIKNKNRVCGDQVTSTLLLKLILIIFEV